jgi:hypothetical protein
MLTIVLVLVAVGLFVLGVMWPRRSRHFAHKANRFLRPWERKADRLPGVLGWLAKSPFLTSRKVANVSTKKGRQTRDKLPGD